jgi:uncharacterized protein
VSFPDNEKFARLRVARLWLWPLVGATSCVVAFLLVTRSSDPPFVPVAYATYGFLLLAALKSLRQADIRPTEVFGAPPEEVTTWRTVILMVPVMFCFAAMSLWATAYAAAWIVPDLAEFLFREQRDAGPFGALGESGSTLLILFIVVVGPVVEEFVFRGIILRRWMAKSGFWRGVIGSSIIFALLHPPFWIGAMVVGVFLSLVYLATRSLYAPIAFHVMYNGLVTFATIGADRVGAADKVTTVAEFRQQWAGELVLLLVSGWIILRVGRRFAAEARASGVPTGRVP